MREATCARTKTSKVPTRVALLYLSYSVVGSREQPLSWLNLVEPLRSYYEENKDFHAVMANVSEGIL